MKSQIIAHYDAPHQFEPLMPDERALGPLLEQASDLTRAAMSLVASTSAQDELRGLLRAMNSYYTHKIEGEHTRPSEIEQALARELSGDDEVARRQRLAIAHMQAELVCEAAIDGSPVNAAERIRNLYASDNLRQIHLRLFEHLPPQDLRLRNGSLLVPGAWRTFQVAVGRHEAPLSSSLQRFMDRWTEVYGGARRGELSIVAAAASHHRLAWVHPFPDGNGRVARLHTHLVLHAMGLTRGLWSPLRGFARTEQGYRAHLQAADEHRRGDLDGRGNLTQQGLVEWVRYALDVFLDQVRFMSAQLETNTIVDRIRAALLFEQASGQTGVRVEALRGLHYLFATHAELGRADFKAMTGLGERLATGLLSALLKAGYLSTDSPYGPVRFAVPRHALRFYFPNLWPEAEQDPGMQVPGPARGRRLPYEVKAMDAPAPAGVPFKLARKGQPARGKG